MKVYREETPRKGKTPEGVKVKLGCGAQSVKRQVFTNHHGM
jgi:hypothetical protein